MTFSVNNSEADRLVRELVALTGESLTTAVTESLRERLERERRVRADRYQQILLCADRFAQLRIFGDRAEDEIFGWDEHGLPT
jgi:antitoxin VapB